MTSITINFDEQTDLNLAYARIKSLFPDAKITQSKIEDLLLASESSLAF